MTESGSKTNLTLVDAFVPMLTAGEYTLEATQSLSVTVEKKEKEDKEEEKALDSFETSKKFFVRGPRFTIAPDEIYSRYPADGHRGAYHQTVPHVVCRRKALPWERPLVPNQPSLPDSKAPPEPWIALLLFNEAEFKEAGLPDPPPFASRSFQEVVQPPTGIRGPKIALDPWETDQKPAAGGGKERNNRCTALDIPLALFRKAAPRLDELRRLAHARLVDTRDKEDVYGVGDGWFAVVLANRLPADKQRNIAVLVSLEGFIDLIDRAEPAQGDATIRLVVLDHWTFVSEGETFEQRVENLHKGKDIWLRAADGSNVDAGPVHEALTLGYVPLQHCLRHGDRTVSWYRGPLTPVSIPAATRSLIFANADEALQYDANTHMLDASYAAAWQLGRLLALQAPEFARAVFSFDSGYVAEALMRKAETKFRDFNPKESPEAQSARRLARLERAKQLQGDDLMVALALEWSA
jgi:hypothetical protein